MDFEALERSALFKGFSVADLDVMLEQTPHRVQRYDKEEVVFKRGDVATWIGIVMEGRVQVEKTFPNGSRVNVSVRARGEMLGHAAAFSKARRYPCDVIALEKSSIVMIRRDDLLHLMQRDSRVLENFTTEIATATYMLQQRIELLSYSGIAQKVAFWLLMERRQHGRSVIPVPESVTRWALLMNVSRPSLHRELRNMEARGLIRYASHAVEILDMEGLQALLNR